MQTVIILNLKVVERFLLQGLKKEGWGGDDFWRMELKRSVSFVLFLLNA